MCISAYEVGKRSRLLVDVDGVLNREIPIIGGRQQVPEDCVYTQVLGGYPVAYRPEDGPALLSLTDVVDLWWCTAWGQAANEAWAPLLGLPQLPVLEVGEAPLRRRGWHWKRPAVDAATGGESVAWIDDEFTADDLDWAARRGHLLIRTDARAGLAPEHIAHIRGWAQTRENDHDGDRWGAAGHDMC